MWEQFWEMLTCCCVYVTHSHPRQEEVKVWGERLGVSPEEESSKSTIHSPLSPAIPQAFIKSSGASQRGGVTCRGSRSCWGGRGGGGGGGTTAGHLTRDHLKGPRRRSLLPPRDEQRCSVLGGMSAFVMQWNEACKSVKLHRIN